MDDLVSIIIPTYNRLIFLKKAVESAMSQTYRNIEVIIIDAGSNDGTCDYLKNLQKNHENSLKVFLSKENLNGSQARNMGAKQAEGKWLAFLDDDDVALPNKIELQLDLALSNAKAVAVSSNYIVVKDNKRKLVVLPQALSLQKMLQDNYLGGASVCFCLKEIFFEVGGFDEKLLSSQDHDLWLKFFLKGPVLICQAATVLYYIHGKSSVTKCFNSKYLGRRRFYFLYKHMMNKPTRACYFAMLLWIRIFTDKCAMKKYFCYLSWTLLKNGYYKNVLYALRFFLINRK